MKEKKTLLIITNIINNEKEDFILASGLKKYFERVIVADIKCCKKHESESDLIIIRNIWPIEEVFKYFLLAILRWKLKRKKIYIHPNAKTIKLKGKKYLVDLFCKKYPVIPTIQSGKDLNKIDFAKKYMMKPIIGCDGKGQKVITKSQLEKLSTRKFIIQPIINFKKEVSFYFLDNKFCYAISCQHKLNKYETTRIYTPNKKEISWAKKFVNWNNLSFGLQRIDACIKKDGSMLLVEIEDSSFFLNLHLLKKEKRNLFIFHLKNSINNLLK